MKREIHASLMTAAFLAVAISGSACDDEDNLAFKTKATKSNLCGEVAEVMCKNIFECCQGSQIEADFGVKITTSEEDCRRDMRLECEKQTAYLQYGLDKGSVTLVADAVNSCLKAYTVGKDGCFPHVSEFAPECNAEMVQGALAAGAACLYSFECAKNTYCGSDRKCKALPSQGESCETDFLCASGLYCGINDEGTGYFCQSLKAAGEECGGSAECQEGTVCIASDDGASTVCSALKAVGESCDAHSVCETGYCLPGACADGSVCQSDDDCGGTCEISGVPCTDALDCGATCSVSGTSCQSDADCGGTCSVSATTCYGNDYCDYGTCSVSGNTCYDVEEYDYCNTDPSDVCVQQDQCVSSETCVSTDVCQGASTCEGRVCAESYVIADYCTSSLMNAFAVDTAAVNF